MESLLKHRWARRRPRGWLAGIAVLSGIAVVLTGCGSAPTPEPPGGSTGEAATPSGAAEATAELAGGALPVTDVCSLLSVDEAATALGSAPMGATPGEEPDEASGGTIRFCTYLGQGTALVVSVVETDSADAAAAAAQAAVAAMQEGEVDAQLSSETGLGESATWVVTPQAAGYTVVSGARAFSVSLGGPGIGDPAAHQAALRALAETLAGRL